LRRQALIVLNTKIDKGGMRRLFVPKLIAASVLAGCAFATLVLLSVVPNAQRVTGMASDGVTIPIQPLIAPLRREETEQPPVELRPTLRELPREAPPQKWRKPARTQFADMDLASPAG
jgi:hypothetical protein